MSRRRPTLAIGGAISRTTLSKPVAANGRSGLGLLGAYADEDSEEDDNKALPSHEPSDAPQDSVDSKVMDFLKEIDSLDSTETNVDSNTNAGSNDADKSRWGNWKQCVDEKTQHPYYWNTQTNEVTWKLPPGIGGNQDKIDEAKNNLDKVTDNGKSGSGNTSDQLTAPEESTTSVDKVKVGKIISDKQIKKTSVSEIDIDAELDNALEGKSDIKKEEDIFSSADLTEYELELLRVDDLPLSSEDADILMKKYQDEIYKLEDLEEKLRYRNEWKTRARRIEDVKYTIRDYKEKWKKKVKEILSHLRRSTSRHSPEYRRRDKEPSAERHHLPRRSLSRERKDKKASISKLSSLLLEKLDYLQIRQEASSISLLKLLISIETRLNDWKEEEIRSSYLLRKLQESDDKLRSFELAASPLGWSCNWDSSKKKYYFRNEITLESQWSFPKCDESEKRWDGGFGLKLRSVLNKTRRSQSPDKDQHKIKKRKKDDITDKLFRSSLNIKRHRSESPSTTKLKSEFKNGVFEKPKPSLTTVHSSLGALVSGGKGIPRPPKDNEPPPLPTEQPPMPPSPPSPEEGEIGEDGGIVMEMSDGELESAIITTNIPVKKSQTGPSTKPAINYQNNEQETKAALVQTSNDTAKKVTKVKKAKKVKKAGAVAKPPKQMNSLVAQWQKAKNEMEEEERQLIQEAEQEEQEDDPNKKIEKWKLQQIISGDASKNANFEPVGDAWKARVKKRVT